MSREPGESAGAPVTVIAELRFAPEHRETMLAAARQHARRSLANEPGCLRFELVVPKDALDRLVFVETYRDAASFRAHQAAGHAAPWREATAGLILERQIRELVAVEPCSRGIVLVTVPALAKRQELLEPLVEAGFELRLNDLGRVMSEAELIERLDGVTATLASLEPYTERVFAAAPGLRTVARLGVGYDQVDLAAASRHRVAVAMAFGTNHETVADHAFALMAALALQLPIYDRRTREGGWGSRFHSRLHGTKVGLVGFGRVGRALTKRCQGFNMEVMVADPMMDAGTVSHLGVELVGLDQLMAQADFISLHAPLTPETYHLIDARRLALMKPSAYLVNTARGGLVDEAALVQALQEGRIGGAGLDVFETEPLPESPLRALDNVVLTPHVAGLSAWSLRSMTERCAENIVAITAGRDPGDGLLLNPEVLAAA